MSSTDPKHYADQKIQPIEYIVSNSLNFMEGNVLKYVTRHRDKNGAEDIKKAIRYLEFLLEAEYNIPDKRKDILTDMTRFDEFQAFLDHFETSSYWIPKRAVAQYFFKDFVNDEETD